MTDFTIPTIRTQRLTLRGGRVEDFPQFVEELAKPRTRYMDGPHNSDVAWAFFTNDLASWPLFGVGGLMIERGGDVVGQVAISKPPQFAELEIGWIIYEAHEGHGYAAEAAFALRDWAYANAGLTTLVSYVDRENSASIRIAEKLGAAPDPEAALPRGETADETIVFRHPSPAALADGGMEAYA